MRLSLRKGGAAWKEAILHNLAALENHLVDLPEAFDAADDEFERLHKNYHQTLISACGSERLMRYCSALYDETYRYRQIFLAQPRTRKLFQIEHRTLTEHVLSGVEERAVASLTLHLNSTLAAVTGSKGPLKSGPSQPKPTKNVGTSTGRDSSGSEADMNGH